MPDKAVKVISGQADRLEPFFNQICIGTAGAEDAVADELRRGLGGGTEAEPLLFRDDE